MIAGLVEHGKDRLGNRRRIVHWHEHPADPVAQQLLGPARAARRDDWQSRRQGFDQNARRPFEGRGRHEQACPLHPAANVGNAAWHIDAFGQAEALHMRVMVGPAFAVAQDDQPHRPNPPDDRQRFQQQIETLLPCQPPDREQHRHILVEPGVRRPLAQALEECFGDDGIGQFDAALRTAHTFAQRVGRFARYGNDQVGAIVQPLLQPPLRRFGEALADPFPRKLAVRVHARAKHHRRTSRSQPPARQAHRQMDGRDSGEHGVGLIAFDPAPELPKSIDRPRLPPRSGSACQHRQAHMPFQQFVEITVAPDRHEIDPPTGCGERIGKTRQPPLRSAAAEGMDDNGDVPCPRGWTEGDDLPGFG